MLDSKKWKFEELRCEHRRFLHIGCRFSYRRSLKLPINREDRAHGRVKVYWVFLFPFITRLIFLPDCFARNHSAQKALITLDQVALPLDQEACFSPDEPCDLKLIKLIQSAQKSIDMAVYDINRDQLVHHLVIQSKKIPVRLVVDRRQSKGSHSLVPLLIKAGVKLRYGKQRGIMHDKFTIVDGKILETGSFNYTNHASESNQENQVYLSSPTLLERFKLRFESIWSHAVSPE